MMRRWHGSYSVRNYFILDCHKQIILDYVRQSVSHFFHPMAYVKEKSRIPAQT